MISLQGRLTVSDLCNLNEKTDLYFRDSKKFKTAESLIVYEQNLLPEDELLELCSQEYGMKLSTPRREYIPSAVLEKFRGKNCVPIKYSSASNVMEVGVIPEYRDNFIMCGNYVIKRTLVPLYYYVTLHRDYYGEPDFLYPLPDKDYLDFIYSEAINLKASDITIYDIGNNQARVIYNVRKRLVHSRRTIKGSQVLKLCELLAQSAGQAMDTSNVEPRYFSCRIDEHNRGRVVINKTYFGWAITIRILPDDFLTTTLEDLNIKPSACDFIRNVVLSKEKGLRLFIGETMSGKNTTILSGLMELVKEDRYKIVSIENPVETLVQGVIQINVESEEEFDKNADSLLRQNPDIVYFAEITERNAYAVLKQSNTSKAVFSTLHANSISDVVSRLVDITKLDADRIIMTLQSCVYQVLVRDEDTDTIYPINRCINFDYELKQKLYGQPLYVIQSILKELEDAWC